MPRIIAKTKVDAEPEDLGVSAEITITEQAYKLLRAQILSGELQPSQKLTLQLLQKKLGFSSSPLREALSRLSSDMLVLMDGRRGFRVAPISGSDIEDITFLRLALETIALEQSISEGRDDWEARVVASFHKLELVESRVDFGRASRDDTWTERHRDFHLALLSASTSPRLLFTCANLFDHSERYRRLSPRLRKDRRNTTDEHKKIMNAALKRDKVGAVALLRRHYIQTTENLVSELSRSKNTKSSAK